jgi:hypothetical protein
MESLFLNVTYPMAHIPDYGAQQGFGALTLIFFIGAMIAAGFRIKALGRSPSNIILIIIPIVGFVYALWLGITTDKR